MSAHVYVLQHTTNTRQYWGTPPGSCRLGDARWVDGNAFALSFGSAAEAEGYATAHGVTEASPVPYRHDDGNRQITEREGR